MTASALPSPPNFDDITRKEVTTQNEAGHPPEKIDAGDVLKRSERQAAENVKELVRDIGSGATRGGAFAVGKRAMEWLLDILTNISDG